MTDPAPLSLTCPACGGEGALMMLLGKIRSSRATCLKCGRVWDSAAPTPRKGEGSPPPTAPDCPRHGHYRGPSAPGWCVGCLREEVARLREVIALSRVRELVDRVTAAEAEVGRLREQVADHEGQLVWLADWCRGTLGVEPNALIGREGWPCRLVEVVARVAEAENARLREALEVVEAWGPFPATTTGKPYGWHYGSNGERDYMRRIARQALAGKDGAP